jgi:CubicO group peptidase (beta-lactamase class C family)
MLVEDGKMRLDDKIIEFIENTPAAWKEITIRQLLSHTSGLGGGHPVERDGSPLLDISTRQQFDDIAHSALQYAPGEGATYSDPGYFLLGMIIEKVSGMRYGEFMRQRLFSPCSMNSTRIEDRRAIVKNHVGEYTLREGRLEQGRRVWQHELPSFYGMWTTVDDLAKWIIALVKGQVVKMETLAQMWTPIRLKNGDLALVDGFPYGLGWFVVDVDGHRLVGHPGFFGSALFHYVDEQLTIILITNLDVEAIGPYQVELAQGIIAHLRPDIPRWFKKDL